MCVLLVKYLVKLCRSCGKFLPNHIFFGFAPCTPATAKHRISHPFVLFPSARCTTYRSELALDNAADVTRRSGLDTSVSWANGVVVGRSKEASRTFISI